MSNTWHTNQCLHPQFLFWLKFLCKRQHRTLDKHAWHFSHQSEFSLLNKKYCWKRSLKFKVYFQSCCMERSGNICILCYEKKIYSRVASSRLSHLVAHSRIFRLFMKGKFDAYVLWPSAKNFQSRLKFFCKNMSSNLWLSNLVHETIRN